MKYGSFVCRPLSEAQQSAQTREAAICGCVGTLLLSLAVLIGSFQKPSLKPKHIQLAHFIDELLPQEFADTVQLLKFKFILNLFVIPQKRFVVGFGESLNRFGIEHDVPTFFGRFFDLGVQPFVGKASRREPRRGGLGVPFPTVPNRKDCPVVVFFSLADGFLFVDADEVALWYVCVGYFIAETPFG